MIAVSGVKKSYRMEPVKPEYEPLVCRLYSFKYWPRGLQQTPSSLADAGFFYTGFGDKTCCFQCGVEIEFWKVNDSPWKEHALESPDCRHVRISKGRCFVREVLNELGGGVPRLVKKYMCKEPAISVLSEGVPYDDVKDAIREKIEEDESIPLGYFELYEKSVEVGMRKKKSRQISGAQCFVPDSDASCETLIGEDTCSEMLIDEDESLSNLACSKLFISKKLEKINVLCKICCEKKISVLILPCGHLSVCSQCCSFSTLKKCPVCCGAMKGFVNVFF